MRSSKFIAIIFGISALIMGCSTRPPGQYVIDSQGHWQKLSDKESLIATFKSKVRMTAYYEKRGDPPPDREYSWHHYWMKVVPYWTGSQEFGTHEEIMSYIAHERRKHGLPPL